MSRGIVKLIFYSGGAESENRLLDDILIKQFCHTSDPLMTFIPACSFDAQIDFRDFVVHYQKNYRVKRFLYFPIDVPIDRTLKREVLKSHIIHIGGGNTFYLLKYLRSSGFDKELKIFVKKGGILTGLSAGAIVMTPNITTASFPSFDCDENIENLVNLAAMNLCNFEFFPHYKNSARYKKELLKYSYKINHPLWACPDGSGIAFANQQFTFVGKAFGFYQGRAFNILK